MDVVNTDVCIVGSGVGGLTAGAILAKQGLKVTLVEAHDKIGGFASHFKRKGYSFEVAVHILEGKSKFNPRDDIFDYLNVYDLDFVQSPSFYKVFFKDSSYEVPTGLEENHQFFLKNFPEESIGLNTFFKDLYSLASEYTEFQKSNTYMGPGNPMFSILMPTMSRLLSIPITNYIGGLFEDRKLMWTIMATVGFYTGDPVDYSTAFFLINTLFYLDGGAYYLEGGSQSLSNHLASIITDSGGEIILNHCAISSKGNELVIKKTRGSEHTESKIKFRELILNCSPDQASEILNSKKEETLTSTSVLSLYLGMKQDYVKEANNDLSYFNFFTDIEQGPNRLSNSPLEFSLVNYSILSESFKKKPTIDIMILEKWDMWLNKTDNYDEEKTLMLNRMLKRLNELYPQFTPMIELSELATPLTVKKFTRNNNGAVYGPLSNTIVSDKMLKRRWIGHNPKDLNYENVYYASAWSSSHGITGVVSGGYQAAKAILDKKEVKFSLFH